MTRLSEIIYPNMKTARSINIERDRRNISQLEDYILTTKTLEILQRFADALEGELVSAWSLTGPYGMGKSAFANYFLSLTGEIQPLAKKAAEKLKKSDLKLYQRILSGMNRMNAANGFFQIAVTAAYEPVNVTLIRGLKDAITNSGFDEKEDLIKRLQSLRVDESREVLKVLQSVQKIAAKPIVVVIDEFGKNLEYMAHHNARGDLFIVQQLAEMNSVYLWVCLHQAFDEYASGLSALQRREWSKIHGRFEDISFVETTAQMINLIQKSLQSQMNTEQERLVREWADEAFRFVSQNQADVIKNGLNRDTIAATYPLHPVSTLALIELCKQFTQNDRTLLSFIGSGDSLALPAYLERTELGPAGKLPNMDLEVLYDYFLNVTTTTYINRAESQRWIEIQNRLQEALSLSLKDQKLLKNIGVLNLLSHKIGFKADVDTLAAVMGMSSESDKDEIKKSLDNLVTKHTLIYREYKGEYRLWEGSDFDINGAIETAKSKLTLNSLDSVMQQFLPLAPVIASRHAYETGTIRRFERRWLDEESLDTNLKPEKGFDGLLVYSFGSLPEPSFVPQKCADKRPLVVAYVPARATLYELALEAAATRSVLEDAPELEHDSVARKELAFRVQVAEQRFYEHVTALFQADNEDLRWYVNGELRPDVKPRMISSVLSDLCDKCYYLSPRIGNEMISYEKLSSAAARARRELVEAMASNASQENLGLQGFGPEVAIYRSLLLTPGLHKKNDKTGLWEFTLECNVPSLQRLWDHLDSWISEAGEKGIQVSEVLARLQEPPFGMRQGPSPIYLCLYLLVRAEEIAVFKEDTYRPYLSAADVSLLVKRPDLYVLKRFVSNHIERRVFEAYQGVIKLAQIQSPPGLRNATMLGVAGPLIKFISGLPPYTQKTRQVSPAAQRVRSAIQNSTDPIQLLFVDIPLALDIDINDNDPSVWIDELTYRLQSALQELADAYPALNLRVQQAMMNAFQIYDLFELYETQRKRVAELIKVCDDPELLAVMRAFARRSDDPVDWVRGIAGIITKKHLDSWRDNDFDPFAARLRDFVERTNQLEILASMTGLGPVEQTRLLTLMAPNGQMRRTALNLNGNDPEVKTYVDSIMELPLDKSKAILGALAERLMEESADEQ